MRSIECFFQISTFTPNASGETLALEFTFFDVKPCSSISTFFSVDHIPGSTGLHKVVSLLKHTLEPFRNEKK